MNMINTLHFGIIKTVENQYNYKVSAES